MRLSTMEIKSEKMEYIAIFWQLLNEVLSLVKGGPGHKFNPCTFLISESGITYNGIKYVFCSEGIRKSKVCQWHFKSCVNRKVNSLPEQQMAEFQKITFSMHRAPTVSMHNSLDSLEGELEAYVTEIQHSIMKASHTLMLVDASWEDTSAMKVQEQNYKTSVDNTGYESEKRTKWKEDRCKGWKNSNAAGHRICRETCWFGSSSEDAIAFKVLGLCGWKEDGQYKCQDKLSQVFYHFNMVSTCKIQLWRDMRSQWLMTHIKA